jgi:putative SOS response-associated peptidase YedK
MTLTTDDYESVARELDAVVDPEVAAHFVPRFNVAPSDLHWIVRPGPGGSPRVLMGARWGFARDDGGLWVNARAERLATSPAHRPAFVNGRCIVIADGFFEWSGPREDRRPWWLHRADRGLLLFAGLVQDEIDATTRRAERRFTVVTTSANADVRPLHGRMPALIRGADLGAWLTGADEHALRELLRPAPAGTLVATPVGKRVNRVDNDDPECIAPVPAPPRQGSLFGGR